MKFTRLGINAAVLAAAGTAVVAATPASAHGAPFTVTAGSAPAGTSVAVSLTTSGASPQFAFKDTTGGVTVTCTSVALRGQLIVGNDNHAIGTIDGASSRFNGCVAFAGLQFAVTGSGTWTVDVTDSTAGVSTITVGNVRAHLVSTAGPTCAWDFASPTGSFVSSTTATTTPGALATTYTNSTRQLALPASNPGSLGLWNVHGSGTTTYCVSPAIWKQGDRMSWSASWTVNADAAANDPIAIN